VLYGAGPGCDAAGEAVQKLVTGGFTNVIEYDGGLAAWNESKRARVARAGRKA
jgi:rhodanese-related sulfurtransferase